MEPMILASKSLFKEKTKDILSKIKKVLGVIGSFITVRLARVGGSLSDKIKRIYYRVYPKIGSFKARIKKILYRLNLVILITIAILFILDIILVNNFDIKTLEGVPLELVKVEAVMIAAEVLLYAVVILFLNIYHKNYGEEAIYEIERQYTASYVQNIFPNIGKAWGYTGQGKDELLAGISTMKIEGFKKTIADKIEEIENICYFYNFSLIEAIISDSTELFLSSNEDITKKNFMRLCIEHNYFLKKAYLKKINLDEFLESCKILKQNKLYTSPYIYDKGGINKKHYIELLYEYIMLQVRMMEEHFLFVNQPFIENMYSGKGAAKFSLNYLITKAQKPKKITITDDCGKKVAVEHVEKIMFPFKDYFGILETEAATWYSNIEKQNRAILQELGLREAKAFNRHMFEHFFWYQVDQDPFRVDKLFRELDHAYFYPDTRNVYEGGFSGNKYLDKRIDKINHKLDKLEKKQNKNFIRNMKLEERQRKNIRYYVASSNQKYKDAADAARDRKKRLDFENKISKLQELRKNYLQEKVLNSYNHCYITKIITVGREPAKNGDKPVNTPLNIINHPDMLKSSYSVKLTFKASDCWRYNTHYMESVKHNRSSKTEVSLTEVDEWDCSLELKKEDIATFGYIQAAELFDVEPEEILLKRYKKNETKC